MRLSKDYLEDALKKLGDMAEGKKAEALKVHRNTLISYKNGDRIMDDYACIIVAEYLGIDPLEIIAAANMEREKSLDKQEFWRNFRAKIGQLVVAGLVILTTAFSPVQDTKAPRGV